MKYTSVLIICILAFITNLNAQISHEEQQKIDSLFLKWDNESSPGAAMAIFKNGVIVYKNGYGIANLDYKYPSYETGLDNSFKICIGSYCSICTICSFGAYSPC